MVVIKSLASKLFPGLDEAVWNRQRNQLLRSASVMSPYAEFLAHFPKLGAAAVEETSTRRETHVIVVPQDGPASDSWGPGTRNFYYEAAQILAEDLGVAKVTIFRVELGEAPESWHIRLMTLAIESNATHILTHIESDPTGPDTGWSWDVVWSMLSPRWDGVLLGVMFDSAYSWILACSKRLAKMSPRFVAVDICMPLNGTLHRGRIEVGPVNMPMSRQSMALVDERIAGLGRSFDVSFIGALYPYRVEMLDELRSRGISVAVNPHRPDETKDFAESRTNQPSWLDYMAGLKMSQMTLNFSRSSAGPYEQYKTRIIEAALVGCLPVTDDRERTRLFFTEDEFAYFPSVDALPAVVEEVLRDPELLAAMQQSTEARARALAHTDFWTRIDAVLDLRGLPVVYDDKS